VLFDGGALAEGVGHGAAGIRCCDLRCPESVGIIRVGLGDGEQEMIAEFFPEIKDSLSISGRPADKVMPAFAVRGNVPLGDSPAGGFADCTRPLARGRRNRFKQGGG
jgi:hypothetical protein